MKEIPQSDLSFPEMFERLRGCTDPEVLRERTPKVCLAAQRAAPGASRIWFSDVYSTPQGRPFSTGKLLAIPTTRISSEAAFKTTVFNGTLRVAALIVLHTVVARYTASTFTWGWAGAASAVFSLNMIGLVAGFHRMLAHKSFTTAKWLEYLIAFLGACGGQSHPIEWVSRHRQHHRHADTPLDPHSPHEGFWWAYCLFLTGSEWSAMEYGNTPDLSSQKFYRVLQYTTNPLVYLLRPYVTYKLGGLAALVWTWAIPITLSFHSAFIMSAAGHCWGSRPYDTGDLSTNVWWLAVFTFGEAFHNNHHQFPTSARAGLEWHEIDMCWLFIRGLELLGLAWDVKVPSQRERALAPRTADRSKLVLTEITEEEGEGDDAHFVAAEIVLRAPAGAVKAKDA
ncbi:hypothetical protein Rsub_09714 [Raphidocelis subcapitata]|uniref:Fatty acid desaturase domain-containing protein n=1 Tax=Raphidocelis subcapitata TaxID=307507 RepID=A0A2V0PAH6_9CHLO|nr:hypothetical protein Rsub_09714 [Raphidocelis subcapitata]|eukprot:GBF96858.1 hypothetical protein Rsub_09714 [Raphidocelis subcapitata]